MKISKRTLDILKNFSTINNSIVVKPGNKISTISNAQNILATVDVDETFETEFGIYDLSRFLGVVSLIDDPDFDFQEKMVIINGNRNSIRYPYVAASNVLVPPSNEIKLPTIDASFELKNNDIERILKVASIMSLPYISFFGNGEKVYIRALSSENITDVDNEAANVSVIEIGETEKTFNAVFKAQFFRLLPNDYKVEITSKGVAKFSGDLQSDIYRINYWIATEKDSSFE